MTPPTRFLGSFAFLALCLATARLAGAAPAGTLDPSFSGDGIVVTPIGTDDLPRDVAVQPDGRIVVAGSASTLGQPTFAVARYLATGALDSSFGSGGVVTTVVGGAGAVSAANACAIQGDGKIVLAGSATVSGTQRVALARYLTSGVLDPSFGTGGTVTTPVGTGASAAGLAIAPDGKLVVTGYVSNATDDVLVARYLTSGAPDPTFGTSGVVTTPIGTLGDFGNVVAVQADGKIVVGADRETAPESLEGALLRYTTSGGLDGTFGVGGVRATPFGVQSSVRSLALQLDGRIVVGGRNSNGDSSDDFVVARYTTVGSPDASFGTAGVSVTPIGTAMDQLFDVALQHDGKLLAIGRSEIGASAVLQVALARYTTGGALDPSFGTGGRVTTPIGTVSDTGRGIAVTPTGRVIVTGSTDLATGDTQWFAARYLGADSSIPALRREVSAALAVALLAATWLALRRRLAS